MFSHLITNFPSVNSRKWWEKTLVRFSQLGTFSELWLVVAVNIEIHYIRAIEKGYKCLHTVSVRGSYSCPTNFAKVYSLFVITLSTAIFCSNGPWSIKQQRISIGYEYNSHSKYVLLNLFQQFLFLHSTILDY